MCCLQKWQGYSAKHNSWEPLESFGKDHEGIAEFNAQRDAEENEAAQQRDNEELVLSDEEENGVAPKPAPNKLVSQFTDLCSSDPDDPFSVRMIQLVKKLLVLHQQLELSRAEVHLQSTGAISQLPVKQVSSLLHTGTDKVKDSSKNLLLAAGNESEYAKQGEVCFCRISTTNSLARCRSLKTVDRSSTLLIS